VQGWGLTKERSLPEIATPFGGGFGGSHRLSCGALSGALLALGAARAAGRLTRGQSYDLAAQLVDDFERTFGTALCSELVGLDLDNDDWREGYEARHAHGTICWTCVEFAVRRSWEVMEGRQPHG